MRTIVSESQQSWLVLLVFWVSAGWYNTSLLLAETKGDFRQPIVSKTVPWEETGGLLSVEAEHFLQQTETEKRAWYRASSAGAAEVLPDGDPAHVEGASGGAYLEILPDTRRTHADRLVSGENFSNQPGRLAVLHYRVYFNTAGRYYVWVRAFSTGSEDNGIHVGLDGQWPESGQRLQWCVGKNTWRWESKQRTRAVHCGESHRIFLDVQSPGEHVVSFSMREDGFEFDKWLMTTDRDFVRPADAGPKSGRRKGLMPESFAVIPKVETAPSDLPRGPDGEGAVNITGELKQWHKVTLNLAGPYAEEQDVSPNPFTDYRMMVRFTHASGSPSYDVPGYFAADGKAAETSATAGNVWRAHLAPDKPGRWDYRVSFGSGKQIAVSLAEQGRGVVPFEGVQGHFFIGPTDKTGADFRGKGRLEYVGERYLRFAGSGNYFLKAGPDAPETLLAYVDFDGTTAGKEKVPLKTWQAHRGDWRLGDPTWQAGKGKGLIGALNYLSGKGCRAFSFLTYNVGGDGDNVWPMTTAEDKLHYDCSKLDQWQIVFDHGQKLGLFLHFKTQETENDDWNQGKGETTQAIPASLDAGELGLQRKLYYRELVARFGYALALNWNLGEENTQRPDVQRAMANYFLDVDPYDHPIVLHTFPGQQNKVYRPLLGKRSKLAGVSLQNSWNQAHQQTLHWVEESARQGRPWVCCNDEQGPAGLGVPPDIGYQGFSGKTKLGRNGYDLHDVRKLTLWGTMMAGGAGVEYYFGYKLPQNDLLCEDFRSRDQSWESCRIALTFFDGLAVPLNEMHCLDELVGNPKHDNSKYCFAKRGKLYLVYLPNGGSIELDLTAAAGSYEVRWFNPRSGGAILEGSISQVAGGGPVGLGQPPADPQEDWLVIVRRQAD